MTDHSYSRCSNSLALLQQLFERICKTASHRRTFSWCFQHLVSRYIHILIYSPLVTVFSNQSTGFFDLQKILIPHECYHLTKQLTQLTTNLLYSERMHRALRIIEFHNLLTQSLLPHFRAIFQFYTPLKTSETSGFLTFSGVKKKEHWPEMV